MNPADHFAAVGLTRGDVAGGVMQRLTQFPVEELRQREELQRQRVNVVQHQCEIYFVPKEDQQQWQMLCQMVGVAPDDYFEILLVSDDMMAVGGEFGLDFPNQLGRTSARNSYGSSADSELSCATRQSRATGRRGSKAAPRPSPSAASFAELHSMISRSLRTGFVRLTPLARSFVHSDSSAGSLRDAIGKRRYLAPSLPEVRRNKASHAT